MLQPGTSDMSNLRHSPPKAGGYRAVAAGEGLTGPQEHVNMTTRHVLGQQTQLQEAVPWPWGGAMKASQRLPCISRQPKCSLSGEWDVEGAVPGRREAGSEAQMVSLTTALPVVRSRIQGPKQEDWADAGGQPSDLQDL